VYLIPPPSSARRLGAMHASSVGHVRASALAVGRRCCAQDGVARYASDEYTNAADSLGELSMHLTNDEVNHVKGTPPSPPKSDPAPAQPRPHPSLRALRVNRIPFAGASLRGTRALQPRDLRLERAGITCGDERLVKSGVRAKLDSLGWVRTGHAARLPAT
jgi:hypothetical protein